MASCCPPFNDAVEGHFTERLAERDLTRYRQKGPGPTTRLLQEGLSATGILSGLLLDIGAGVGSLTFELLDRGVARAIAVDASSAYIAAATEEAERRGRSAAIRLVHGDFLSVASQLPEAGIVTLDRVVCCYPFFEPLLEEALAHASQQFAFSYPRDRWPVRAGISLENAARWGKGNPFRAFVHSAAAMQQVISHAGFELLSRRCTWMWAVDVYAKRR